MYETQGIGNLSSRLDEYMPFGLEAGIFLVPSREERPIAEPETYYGYGRRVRQRRGDDGTRGRAVVGVDRSGADLTAPVVPVVPC